MKLWTLEEAQATIDRVEEMLDELQAVAFEAQDLARKMAELVDDPETQNPVSAKHHEFARMLLQQKEVEDRFQDSAMRFHQQGIFLKGHDLVDFPSQIGDNIVLLCYKKGEGTITHWHSQEGGFAQRQVIPTFAQVEQ